MPHSDEIAGRIHSPANPNVSVGTVAVAGSANTFMRSDAAPAIDQNMAPTWTGIHRFAKEIGINLAAAGRALFGLSNNNANLVFVDLGRAGSDLRVGVAGAANDFLTGSAQGDSMVFTLAAGQALIFGTAQIERARCDANGMIISGRLQIANATLIKTTVPFTNGAAAAAGTLLNAPAAGNPTKWVPIDDNGTTRYIPAW